MVIIVFIFLLKLLNRLKDIINISGKLQKLIHLLTFCLSFVFSLYHALSPDKISDVTYKSKQL